MAAKKPRKKATAEKGGMSIAIPPTGYSLRDAAKDFALARRKTFAHDRTKTMGGSDIGKCARRTKYSKLSTPSDEGYVDANGFATRGDIMEDAWTAPFITHWVEKHGGELLYAGQENQVTLQAQAVPISATPDGLAINVDRGILAPYGVPDIGPSKSLVIEMKSISPRYGKHKLPKVEHPMQTMVQLGLIREAMPYKPDFGVVVYVEADNFWIVDAFPVAWDERAYKSLVKRADMIMKATDPNRMLPEGKMKGGSECSECPFAKRCLGFRPYVHGDDPRALKPTQVAKVEKLARAAFEAKQAREAAVRKEAEAEADLILGLGDVKRNFVKGANFMASVKPTEPQMRTDSSKLVALLKAKGATQDEIDACKSPTKGGVKPKYEPVSQ